MRLIRQNIFSVLFLCVVCYVGAGIVQWWFESREYCYAIIEGQKVFVGYPMPDPKILFFNMNPRLDRFLYWLMVDSAICWAFIVFADIVARKAWINIAQRSFAYIVKIYFFAELFSVYWIQFFSAGESFNDIWLQIGCVLYFGYKSYKDERAHNRRSRRANRGN